VFGGVEVATVTARLGEWVNGLIRVEVDYDDVTFAVVVARAINNAPQRCRFSAWRTETPNQVVGLLVNAGQTRTGKPNGSVAYRPSENPDGVTPASNLEIRLEYPA
jgi:hypothetical protein